MAINHFIESHKCCPNRMEPYFYKAMTFINFTNKLIEKNDMNNRLKYYDYALKNIEKGLKLNKNSSNLFFHRGLLKFALNKP